MGAPKKKSPPLCSPHGTRVFLTATVAPHTFARVDALAARAGVSRGVILDRAVDCLDVCDACDGSGTVDDRTCLACAGHRVIPST